MKSLSFSVILARDENLCFSESERLRETMSAKEEKAKAREGVTACIPGGRHTGSLGLIR